MKRFLTSESGAVTVDWTVMAASVVGLGLTSVAAVRTGQNALAGDINDALSSASVAQVGIANSRNSYGFDDGVTTGWSSALISSNAILGNFLGPFAGSDPTLTHQVVLPDGATSATVTFDLLQLDSWDGIGPVSDFSAGGRGDGMGFEIDGVEIGHTWLTNAAAGTPNGSMVIGGTTYTYSMTRHSGGDLWRENGTPVGWQDSRWSVTLTATNPPSGGFRLGLNSTANQGVTDESFGIDNYRVTATTP